MYYIGGNGSWSDWQDGGACSSPCGPGLGGVWNILNNRILLTEVYRTIKVETLSLSRNSKAQDILATKCFSTGIITSTRTCTPAGSCTGNFLKEDPCQEELLHIVDHGDLVEPSEGHTCPFRDFGLDAHCLCKKGERVGRLETRFKEESKDRIWILHCEPIAFQLKVNSSHPFSIFFPIDQSFSFPSFQYLSRWSDRSGLAKQWKRRWLSPLSGMASQLTPFSSVFPPRWTRSK